MCACILNGFRLFFIQIGNLKLYSYIFTMLLICVVLTVYHMIVCYHGEPMLNKRSE